MSMSNTYTYLFKIVLVGDSGVGKTSLVLRFTEDTFTIHHIATIGIDFKFKTLDFGNDDSVKLQIWDTSGQDRFKTVVASFYRGAHGFIVVFDVTEMETFQHVKQWFDEATEWGIGDASRLLIGNKSDLTRERVVPLDMAQDLANQMGIPYIETSAKDTTNVEEAFTSMAHTLMVKVKKANPSLVENSKEHLNVTIGKGKSVSSNSRGFICC